MDGRRTRSSSSSSLFIPQPKIPPHKGNFVMTYFSCPVDAADHSSTTTFSARPRMTTAIGNTYKLKPDEKFSVVDVREIIVQHLQALQSQKYDVTLCRQLAKSMSNSIMSDLKLLGYSRLKFVCTVTIGQMTGQSVRIVSRSVWNPESDTFVSESFRNESLFAVAMVFAVYKE